MVGGSLTEQSVRSPESDREAIRDLLHHYAYCIDTAQPERLREIFSPSVTANYGYGDGGEWHGIDQLVGGLGAQIETFEGTAHMIGNVCISLDGDRARSTCYVAGWHWVKSRGVDAQRPADFLFTGVYVDDLRREPEGWRVIRRRFRRLGPTALTAGVLPDYMRPIE